MLYAPGMIVNQRKPYLAEMNNNNLSQLILQTQMFLLIETVTKSFNGVFVRDNGTISCSNAAENP